MKRQIRTQLIISFIFLMLLIVGLISLMTMSLVSDHFDKYVQKKHDTTLTAYKNELKVSYLINNGTWKPAKLIRKSLINATSCRVYPKASLYENCTRATFLELILIATFFLFILSIFLVLEHCKMVLFWF